jgi:hypothetical protein
VSIVAWDGKVLAADKQATNSGMKILSTKLWNLTNGITLAVAGGLPSGLAMKEWFVAGADPAKWPASQGTDDWARLIVFDGVGLHTYEQICVPIRAMGDFEAWGSGRDFAMGAMAMGATAEKAVEIASSFSVDCGMGIDTSREAR